MRQPLPFSRRRQTTCVIQTVGLLVAVSPVVTPPLSAIVAATALIILSVSFLVDIWWLRQHIPS
jgi:hypothetical protein